MITKWIISSYFFILSLIFFVKVNCMSRTLELACKRNPSLDFCQDSFLRVQSDSPIHFRISDDRLIDRGIPGREDESIEYERARKKPKPENDWSDFGTLFDKPDEPMPEPFSNNTKKEKDSINSELPEGTDPKYCKDYADNFAFYCDQGISLITKDLRPFCVSYIANCPKKSKVLG